jgi:4-amino-4-deoxy-L-arabinose transferase-like glycosyltransferase
VALLWAAGNVILSLGDHPLYSPSEARYARVSQGMWQRGDWLVPRQHGEIRLHKPPLIHWLAQPCIALLGERSEWAVRLPSALAVLLAAGATGWLAARQRDRLAGLITTTLMLVMPLMLFVGRMALIDPILCAFWTIAVCSGYLMLESDESDGARSRRGGWAILFWATVALCILAKGPVGLMPVGIVVVWTAMRHRWRSLWGCRPILGLIVAMLPLLIWAGAVAWQHEQAIDFWYREIVHRSAGGAEERADHVRGLWFFLPIVLVGFFPATALLPLPAVHWRGADARRALARGDVIAYMAVAALLPLVIFSLIPRKLPTYVLPMAGPIAVIAAFGLRRWLDIDEDHDEVRERGDHPARRLPNGITSIAICLTITWGGAMLLAISPRLLDMAELDPSLRESLPGMVAPLALVVMLSVIAAWMWGRARHRATALVLLALGLNVGVTWSWQIENALGRTASPRLLIQRIENQTAATPIALTTWRINDPAIAFYRGSLTPRLEHVFGGDELPDLKTLSNENAEQVVVNDIRGDQAAAGKTASANSRWVIILPEGQWPTLVKLHPDLAAQFSLLMNWQRLSENWQVFIERPNALGPRTSPETSRSAESHGRSRAAP